MDTLGWIAYGLFLIAPVVITGLVVLGAILLFSWIGFSVNRRVGLAVAGLIALGAGGVAYKYMLRGPVAFNAACNSGIGIAVYKSAMADSYLLANPPIFGNGYVHVTDATLEQAILNVAHRNVQYVEIEDWMDPSIRFHLQGSLARFRPPTVASGFFKVFVAPRGSTQCRWLMPEEVGSMDYRHYIQLDLVHKINENLRIQENDKTCVAVDYVLSPLSRYTVEFSLKNKIGERLYKHEIRVVDRHDNVILGTDVAYEYAAENVYQSIAFWLGNGKRHPTCPMNLLEGHPLRATLGIQNY